MSKQDGIEHVLLEEDDLMHEVEDASNYNESAYYNFFDSSAAVGGWVRIGNRVNEGYAEVSVCLYEPDGSAAFQFKRPKIQTNDAFAAGGLSFEVVEPWKHHRVVYDACFLTDPKEMAEPREAFKANPQVPVALDLDWYGRSEGWGGEPRRRTADGGWEPANAGDPEKLAARGHFQQTGVVSGTVTIDGRRYELDGQGHRDHSWGPRYWQNMQDYRWLTITVGPEFGLMGSIFLAPDDPDESKPQSASGFVYRKGQPNVEIDRVELRTEYDDDGGDHRGCQERITARLTAENGEVFDVTGEVLAVVPCRNRRGGGVTRIAEGITRWTCDGHVGYGMTEYLDQLSKPE